MHISADAPLAMLEADHLSVESGSLAGSHRELNNHEREQQEIQVAIDLADEFDLDICLSGSLSDLVGNFDDSVYCTDLARGPEVAQASMKHTDALGQNQATLSQVKFWWREAVDDQPRMDYPLQELQPKLTSYDDFESADVDGITEDGLPNEEVAPDGTGMHKEDSHSVTVSESFSRSIHSSSNSLRSTTPDPQTQRPPSSLLVHTPKLQSRAIPVDHGQVQSELDALREQCPLENGAKSDVSWSQDLTHLSMDALRLYMDQLSADVMNLSDQLVELLATRDELVMLREASDDFVILLNLVHQRRARASRAALLLTARTRMRSKGLFRVALPWLNRNLGLTSASSTFSVMDAADLRGPNVPHETMSGKGGSGTLPHRFADEISLNATSGSAAYYRALNLQSKQRRPRAQVLIPPGQRQTASTADRTRVTWRTVSGMQPNGSVCANGVELKREAWTQPWEQVSLSSSQAQQRLNALRDQCDSLPWPNGQPQASRSLNLCLPYRLDETHGVTLATLRVINQILYGTLLENPATEKLIDTYLNNLSEQVKVTSWIDHNHHWQTNGHMESSTVTNPIESLHEPLSQIV